MAKKKARKSRKLVAGYLERISSRVFSDFQTALKKLVGGQHGLYALYKGNRLYYVGLATNLKSRINQHLRDKHASKWDRFSLYLVRKADHIKELESLVMRIADPKGNTAKGRLKHAQNLNQVLRRLVKADQDEVIIDIFEPKVRESRESKRISNRQERVEGNRKPTLFGLIKKTTALQVNYKGVIYAAKVRRSGRIFIDGKAYNSPSTAAKGLTGKSIDGWHFWKFKNKEGNWVKLDVLRKSE